MKKVLVWVVMIAAVAGIGIMGTKNFQKTISQQSYTLALGELKRQFLIDTNAMYLHDLDQYRKEIGPHLSKYFHSLRKLSKQYPEEYDVERELKIGAQKLVDGRISENSKNERDERINLALDLFQAMSEGSYRPLYSASDKGFRFDIFSIAPATISGQNVVKVSYVHWGPFPVGYKPGRGSPISYKSILGNIKTVQKKGRPAEVPQISGEDQPPVLQVYPERWVTEAPPGLEVGYYALPQFPSAAESITLNFGFGIRSVGGSEHYVDINFPAIDIPDTWKAGGDQKWANQERFADDSELRAAGAKPTQH